MGRIRELSDEAKEKIRASAKARWAAKRESGEGTGFGFKTTKPPKPQYDALIQPEEERPDIPSERLAEETAFDEVETGFKRILHKVMLELKTKTKNPENLDIDDIAKVIKTCRENLTAIAQQKLGKVEDGGIQVFTSVPFKKEGDSK